MMNFLRQTAAVCLRGRGAMLLALCLALFSSATKVLAGSVPATWVKSDAHWVFHLDLETLKTTDLFQFMVQKGHAKRILSPSIPLVNDVFHMDFTRCASLTLFGNMEDDDEAWAGILKLPANYRQELLKSLGKLSRNEDSPLDRIEENNDWNGFSFEDDVFVYSPAADHFVIGDEDSAESICSITTRKTANPPCPLLRGWDRQGAFFLALTCRRGENGESFLPEGMTISLPESVAKSFPQLQQTLNSGLLDAITQGQLFVGESTNHFWMRLVLNATNAPGAVQLRQTLTNGVALAATLTAASHPEWKTLISGITVVARRDTVEISAAHPTKVNGKSIYEGLFEEPIKQAETPATAAKSPPRTVPATVPSASGQKAPPVSAKP